MLYRCLIDGWKSVKTEDLDGIDPSRYDPLCLFSMVEVVDMVQDHLYLSDSRGVIEGIPRWNGTSVSIPYTSPILYDDHCCVYGDMAFLSTCLVLRIFRIIILFR